MCDSTGPELPLEETLCSVGAAWPQQQSQALATSKETLDREALFLTLTQAEGGWCSRLAVQLRGGDLRARPAAAAPSWPEPLTREVYIL